nr:retinol-binding protein pinta-like isoform X1 [Neodiprion pinetum]
MRSLTSFIELHGLNEDRQGQGADIRHNYLDPSHPDPRIVMSIRKLPDDLNAIAKNELGEDEAKIEEHIEIITEWLKKQPHINAREDPQWIAAFLRGCKHSLEVTKQKLEAYYTIRTHLPELFADRDPKGAKISELLDLGIYLPLPATKDPSSPRIILLRGGCYDPSKYNFLDIMRVNYMVMDLMLMEDDRSLIAGQQTILDLTGSKFEHVGQFTPATVKKAVTCFQDAYPLRTKSMHFINLPPSFDMVFNIFKLFLKEKLKNRILIHSDQNTLYEHIPKEILPSDLNGNGPSIAELTAEWKQKVQDKRDWFLEDAQFCVDESKRAGKPVSGADLFGVDGSFKKLSID